MANSSRVGLAFLAVDDAELHSRGRCGEAAGVEKLRWASPWHGANGECAGRASNLWLWARPRISNGGLETRDSAHWVSDFASSCSW
jgi:hypothetical protein